MRKRKGRVARKRLSVRVQAWEKTIKNLPLTANQDGWKKPGSNKK